MCIAESSASPTRWRHAGRAFRAARRTVNGAVCARSCQSPDATGPHRLSNEGRATHHPRELAVRRLAVASAMNGSGMNCVSPPCPGTVRDDQCPVCGLTQRWTPSGVEVDGPLRVTRRSKEGTDRTILGLSATVGDRVVTVHLRHAKETRSFELNALISIEER